ncbi:MAG: hypothetical protein ACTSX7_00020 [Alphaproteobacteria bacterium]
MALSPRAIETLTDLIEIKLSCMQVYDREDARELAALEQCRRELVGMSTNADGSEIVIAEAAGKRRRGPKPRAAAL